MVLLKFFEQRVNPYPTSDATPPTGFFRFVWFCTQGLRRYIALIMLLAAVIGVYEAVLFSLLGHMVDWLATTPPHALWAQKGQTLTLLAVVLLTSPLLVGLHTLLRHQTLAGTFPMRLRWTFHRFLLQQSLSFYHEEFAGRIATKVMQTALAVRDGVMLVCDVLVFITIYFVTMLLVIGEFNAWLIAPFVLWIAGYILAVLYFVPRLSRAASTQADARSLMTGRITDAYTNIYTVKLFSHSRREAAYVKSAMAEFLHTVQGQMRLVSGFAVVNHTLSVLLITSTAGVALWLWTQQQVGVGALAAATGVALRLNGLSQWIMWEVSTLFEHVGTIQDGIQTLTTAHQITDAPDARPLQGATGGIAFERVSFAYSEGSPVLDTLSLTIRPNEKVGLIGRSGAGKSTLVNLLLRFYEVDAGCIRIDGQDIAAVTQESLRRQIGMVTQDTSLLHRTVRENILYGRPDAREEEMIEAAKRAQADDFIAALHDKNGGKGYDAQVGERGVKLSGGQRQRIAIARVMLKNAPILLLDEATSALDSEVEAAIQANLYRLMAGKTVIAIAHRLSTIAAMDRLIVLDKGQMVEEGTHTELLAQNGLYAQLWQHQSGGFLQG